MRNVLVPFAIALCASPASAQDKRKPVGALPSPATFFVGLASKICFYSRSDPSVVKRLAAANRWPAVDPASLPVDSPKYIYEGKAYTRTDAWTLEIAGVTYWLGLFDVPDQPKVRHCSLMTLNQDPDAVDAIFMGGKRNPEDRNKPGWKLPVRTYNEPQATITYSWDNVGQKQLHVISVMTKQ